VSYKPVYQTWSIFGRLRYRKLEQLLLQAKKKEDYTNTMKDIMEFYQSDFNSFELETQLEAFCCMNIQKNGDSILFHDIHKHFKVLEHNQHLLMPQVVKVVKLLILMPATNAVSETSASAMRRKTHTSFQQFNVQTKQCCGCTHTYINT